MQYLGIKTLRSTCIFSKKEYFYSPKIQRTTNNSLAVCTTQAILLTNFIDKTTP